MTLDRRARTPDTGDMMQVRTLDIIRKLVFSSLMVLVYIAVLVTLGLLVYVF